MQELKNLPVESLSIFPPFSIIALLHRFAYCYTDQVDRYPRGPQQDTNQNQSVYESKVRWIYRKQSFDSHSQFHDPSRFRDPLHLNEVNVFEINKCALANVPYRDRRDHVGLLL